MNSESTFRRRICFITLGCAKNEVDTSHMRTRVMEAGYELCREPEAADAIIINTCSFIQSATEESLEAIFEAADIAAGSAKKKLIIVAGCMPARYGDELEEELVEVDSFIPCSKEDDIVAILNRAFKIDPSKMPSTCSDGRFESVEFWETPSAYVKISDGCDRFCTYCTIPHIRGPYHSFEMDKIIKEVDDLITAGIREIVLVAQDSGRWGRDLEGDLHLSDLLEALAQSYPATWFRVMYIQPEGVTDELLRVVDAFDNICSYFDIPLQHADEDILRAMNRSGSAEEYLSLVRRIRDRVSGVSLRTTLIAGFPGESDEAFELLCDFIEEAEFDYVGVFPYSAEEGTKAAEFDAQISEDTKLERAQKLRDLADSLSFSRIGARQGQSFPVLILGREEDGQLYGRAQFQAPDVDGVVYVDKGEVGVIEIVQITDTLLYEMEGISRG